MSASSHPFGKIPEFFAEECDDLELPLSTVVEDTAGFIAAILAIKDPVRRIHMHLYIDPGVTGNNFLYCYLLASEVSREVSLQVSKKVLMGLKAAEIPLTYAKK